MGLKRTVRRRRLLRAGLVGVLSVSILTLSGCRDETEEHEEVLPMVEVPYSTAIRQSLAEVPNSHLVSLGLGEDQDGEPVWHAEVLAEDGTRHLVRVDASRVRVHGTETLERDGAGASPRERAKILPEEAAREVTEPDFGKVTAIELRRRDHRVVWTVDVTTIKDDHVRAYDVDARTGKVLDLRSASPRHD
ncbi:PepSY domain-containing protein [Streptomyces oceani]|uniref:PepSY domain-containing protein n=1 Tax=Streptomyces oceani TaxID=1075402 RepID=A0A1E7JVX7_9ACTN|nr:PepSY domain-containing protein [Streptomyces oceani]OEU94805.1 hypothetical protein AN216_23905 [Streptomyces oceani]